MQEAVEGHGATTLVPPWRDLDDAIIDESSILAGAQVVMPSVVDVWSRFMVVIWVFVAYLVLDAATYVLLDYWILERLGFADVFWTNFWAAAILFVIGLFITAFELLIPTVLYNLSKTARRFLIQATILGDIFLGYILATQATKFLLFLNGQSFGREDAIFGHDIGFYVFDLPAIRAIVSELELAAIMVFLLSATCAFLANKDRVNTSVNRFFRLIGPAATPLTLAAIGLFGVAFAADTFLSRYDLMFKDNLASSIYQGPQALDVSGLFSTVNSIYINTLVILGITAAVIYLLRIANKVAMSEATNVVEWRQPFWRGSYAIGGLVAVSLAFSLLVGLRDRISIGPDEPVVQYEYIQHHIDATRDAYNLNNIEVIPFVPKGEDDAAATADDLLETATLQNVGLWEGSISWLENQLDPEYVERILHPDGGDAIIDNTINAFSNQQQLRPYYGFMDVDTIRFMLDDEMKVFTSAVREVPLVEPKPWLTWWGQMYVLFTHGHGMVMAPVSEATAEGDPVYVSSNVPVQTEYEELQVENPAIYYGEGSGTVAFSNVRGLAELDYPTEQGRAEITLPPGDATSVEVDNPVKRFVFAYHSGQFSDIFFSSLIRSDTHIHARRMPLERVNTVAPFIHFDSDPYAFPAGESYLWLVNGMSFTNQYPYSKRELLGEKSVVRTPHRKDAVEVNYVRDSVKATVNAASGEVVMYKISDDPITNTWAEIYPDLFADESEMPDDVRAQLQYPTQLLHTQFDDIYIYYHMDDPVTFFNLEDMWDDGDEVLGPMYVSGDVINWSIEPYFWVAEPSGSLPASSSPQQFTLGKIFTPEGALNLRSMVMAYQDGEDYGKLSVLQVPKGQYVMGPEQAEAVIDQDPDISQQFQWWTRTGTLVIRGHIMPLVIDDELLYVEPIFIRSQQLENPQLKRVVVVYRGVARMGNTLEEALENAISGERDPAFAPIVTDPGPASTGQP